jgi:hypothetical protein
MLYPDNISEYLDIDLVLVHDSEPAIANIEKA